MSEHSESYHIRTADTKTTIRQLRDGKFAGIVFPADTGWLTFVPYNDGHNFPGVHLNGIAECVETTVMWYFYAQDFGWSFALARPGSENVSFDASWDQDAANDNVNTVIESIQDVLPQPEKIAKLGALLKTAHLLNDDNPPAYRFAQLLGLPAYDWTSPDYVTSEPDNFIKSGGRKIGRKPKPDADRFPTPNRQTNPPRPDLSAREAFDLVVPIMSKFGAEWFPDRFHIEGFGVDQEGRLTDGSAWRFNFRSHQTAGFVSARLWFDGRMTSDGHLFPSVPGLSKPIEPVALPDHWIDTPQLMSMLSTEPAFEDSGFPDHVWVELQHFRDQPTLFWHASCSWDQSEYGRDRVKRDFYAHPDTGKIEGEQVRRIVDGKVVEDETLVRPGTDEDRATDIPTLTMWP